MPGWRLSYCVAGYWFTLEGRGSELRALASSLYRTSRREEPGEAAERFFVERRGERFRLLREGRLVCETDDLVDFFGQVEWALTEAALKNLGSFLQLHAGAAVLEEGACLIVGPPDSGKTSLVLSLAARGIGVLSDEVALLDRDLRVSSFPRDLVVHEGTQRLLGPFLSVRPSPLWKRASGYRYLSLENLPKPPPGSFQVFRLFFPRLRRRGEKPITTRRLGQAETARRLLEQCLNFAQWEEEGMELIGRLAERCQADEIVFSDARRAAEWIVGRSRNTGTRR